MSILYLLVRPAVSIATPSRERLICSPVSCHLDKPAPYPSHIHPIDTSRTCASIQPLLEEFAGGMPIASSHPQWESVDGTADVLWPQNPRVFYAH